MSGGMRSSARYVRCLCKREPFDVHHEKRLVTTPPRRDGQMPPNAAYWIQATPPGVWVHETRNGCLNVAHIQVQLNFTSAPRLC